MSDEVHLNQEKGVRRVIKVRRTKKNKNDDQLKGLTVLAGVLPNDDDSQFQSAKQFDEMLNSGRTFSVNEMQLGMVPHLVGFLKRDDFPPIQVKAAEMLIMIASGPYRDTQAMIDHGAVPLLVKLLNSPNEEVCDVAVGTLGYIARASPRARDIVLSHGVLNLLMELMDKLSEISMLRTATWTLATLCDGTPKPSFEQVKPAYSMLKRLIYLDDDVVIQYACLALCYLPHDDADETIQPLIEADVTPRLVELLPHQSRFMVAPVVRALSYIVAADENQAQSVINHGGLPHFLGILTHNSMTKGIKEDVCFIISSIGSGNQDQIQAVIDAQLIAPLIHLLETAEFEVKMEAASAILHVINCGRTMQIRSAILTGCIKPLCDLLECREPDIVHGCVIALDRIFRVGELEKEMTGRSRNLTAQLIDEAGGIEKIENLHFHDNVEISKRAVKISEIYDYPDEEEIS